MKLVVYIEIIVSVSPDDIFWTTQSFVSELCVVMHHHDQARVFK